MKTTRRAIVCLVCATAVGSALGLEAQSLGEVALREKERRSKVKSDRPAESFSDADLAGLGGGGAGESAGDSSLSGDPSSPASGSAPATVLRERSSLGTAEAYWRDRAQSARRAVEDAERRVNTLDGQFAQFSSRTAAGEPWCARKARWFASERVSARLTLQSAKQRESTLEDEARRAGALPGWVR